MRVALVYNKNDGSIIRASSLTKVNRITEKDVDTLFPNVDTSDFGMIIIEGEQYFDIARYKVKLNQNRNFTAIIDINDPIE